jgi:uncharacterized protein YlxW (UPF0749 family)
MEASSAETPIARAHPSPEAGAAPASRADYGWVWQVTLLALALGVMLALAMRTTTRIRASDDATGSRLGLASAVLARYRGDNTRLQNEVVDLRRELDASSMEANRYTEEAARLRKQLEVLKDIGGLSAISGTGLRLTVRDSPTVPSTENYAEYLVHDQDLNNLIAELKAAGADHLAISGADPANLQRVIVRTTARCVGPTAVVNNTPLSAPYHILVLGSPHQLREYLERPGGYLKNRQLDARGMVTFEEVASLTLPEYSGTFAPRYGKPVPEAEPGRTTDGKSGR